MMELDQSVEFVTIIECSVLVYGAGQKKSAPFPVQSRLTNTHESFLIKSYRSKELEISKKSYSSTMIPFSIRVMVNGFDDIQGYVSRCNQHAVGKS